MPINNINDYKKLLTRRSFIFGAASLASASTILGRLYYLQFIKADEYKTLSEDNRVKLQLIAPTRGLILDNKGISLATNNKNFRLFLDPEADDDPSETLNALLKVIKVGDDKITAVINQVKTSRHSMPILIKENLTHDELAQFEFFHLNYPSLFIDIGQVRYYPFAEECSHLIGYVGVVAKDEIDDYDENSLERLPDFKIGKNGVEKLLESELRGSAGIKQTEVNAHGLAVRELKRKAGENGKDIHLTIDAKLQEYTSRRLAGESAAAVVMNIHNGDILALASMPGYDPNSFSKGISSKYWGELQANPKNPLMNKAISGQYPPGSTFKLITGLAALEAGVINKDSRVSCNGHFMFGNHDFTCWKQGGHGSVNLHDAIMSSCDVFFYTMADRIGIDAIAAMAKKLGLGSVSSLGLSGEKSGIVPDDDWKQSHYGQSWQGGDTVNVGIGQGYVLATPLQLAIMTARIANGGFEVKPRLVANGDAKPKPLGISDDYLALVCDGMNAVVNNPRGTAYGKRITDERFLMAGKTGTSQVRKLIRHGMDQSKLPWEDRHHALFVAYAPIHAPKYAIAVIVEHGGGGASSAAPIASDIMLKLQAMEAGEAGAELPKIPSNGDDEID